MTRRCGISSSASPPLAALALLLLLCISHSAATARLLPGSAAPHRDIGVINVKAADAASEGLVALHTEGGKVGNGEEAVAEVMTAAEDVEEEEEACEEGNDGEECMQRRLLHDAHLDYIYTQRKGRP